MSNYIANNRASQNEKPSPFTNIVLLFLLVCSIFITFLNLPGMLVIAIYNEKIRTLDINQNWTFSFCVTGGLFIIFMALSGSYKAAFRTHVLLSFLVAAYLAVSYFGLEQKYPKQVLQLYMPKGVQQNIGSQSSASVQE